MTWPHAGLYGPESFTAPNGRPAGDAAAALLDHTGGSPVTLYDGPDRAHTVANPTTLDILGNLSMWADPGTYSLRVQLVGFDPIEFPVSIAPNPEDIGDPTQPTGSVLLFNSSREQEGNRFNSWPDLMSYVAGIDGPKVIQFEQAETIPAGAWDLNAAQLWGQGMFARLYIDFPDGVTITGLASGPPYAAHGIVLRSTSDAWTVTLPDPAELFLSDDALVVGQFIDCQGAGITVLGMEFGSGYVKASDLEDDSGDTIAVHVGDDAVVGFVDRGGNSFFQDDVVGGTGLAVRLLYTPAAGVDGAGDTQSGLPGWLGVQYGAAAPRLGFDDTATTFVKGVHVGAAFASTDAKLVDLEARVAALE